MPIGPARQYRGIVAAYLQLNRFETATPTIGENRDCRATNRGHFLAHARGEFDRQRVAIFLRDHFHIDQGLVDLTTAPTDRRVRVTHDVFVRARHASRFLGLEPCVLEVRAWRCFDSDEDLRVVAVWNE